MVAVINFSHFIQTDQAMNLADTKNIEPKFIGDNRQDTMSQARGRLTIEENELVNNKFIGDN